MLGLDAMVVVEVGLGADESDSVVGTLLDVSRGVSIGVENSASLVDISWAAEVVPPKTVVRTELLLCKSADFEERLL